MGVLYGSRPLKVVRTVSKAGNIKREKLFLILKLISQKCALISEFGWEDINSFMNRQRIAYYARFESLPDERLCKMVLNEIRDSKHCKIEYLENIKTILQSTGLDHFINGTIYDHI